jgi:hypothetical protein
MYFEKSSTVMVVVGLACMGFAVVNDVLDYTLISRVWPTFQNYAVTISFKHDATSLGKNLLPPNLPNHRSNGAQTSSVNRIQPLAVRGATFRDSYWLGPEMSEFSWPKP